LPTPSVIALTHASCEATEASTAFLILPCCRCSSLPVPCDPVVAPYGRSPSVDGWSCHACCCCGASCNRHHHPPLCVLRHCRQQQQQAPPAPRPHLSRSLHTLLLAEQLPKQHQQLVPMPNHCLLLLQQQQSLHHCQFGMAVLQRPLLLQLLPIACSRCCMISCIQLSYLASSCAMSLLNLSASCTRKTSGATARCRQPHRQLLTANCSCGEPGGSGAVRPASVAGCNWGNLATASNVPVHVQVVSSRRWHTRCHQPRALSRT